MSYYGEPINFGSILFWLGVFTLIILFFAGIRIVRPTHRGLVERLGKYNRYAEPGFHWIIPVIERMFQVDVREILVEATPQVIITNDNLNASVDAQVYLRVTPTSRASRPPSTTWATTSGRSSTWPAPPCATSSAPCRSRAPTASGQDQRGAAEDPQGRDRQLGHRHRPHRAEGDRPPRTCRTP